MSDAKRDKAVTVWFTQDERDLVNELARRRGLSSSAMLRSWALQQVQQDTTEGTS